VRKELGDLIGRTWWIVKKGAGRRRELSLLFSSRAMSLVCCGYDARPFAVHLKTASTFKTASRSTSSASASVPTLPSSNTHRSSVSPSSFSGYHSPGGRFGFASLRIPILCSVASIPLLRTPSTRFFVNARKPSLQCPTYRLTLSGISQT
jgi:hypothetical protein